MVDVWWWSLMSNLYQAPAKVNLHLAVTDVLSNGFHALDTSFVYIDVGDNLYIKASDTLSVHCSDAVLDGKYNLVYQVLLAFQEKNCVAQGLDVFIDKKLPSQAGLGGGSSDAATALMVANDMWNVGWSTDELVSFAAPFGADIPCFIFGQASCAKGIGEKLIPYNEEVPRQTIVVAWPGEGVSTVQAFAHYDATEIHALTEEKADATVRARSDVVSFEIGYNDLEKIAISLCSPLASMLLKMREKSERAWMSGSGSACVALCHSSKQAYELANYLQNHTLATWVHVGHFVQNHPLQEKCHIGA